MACCAQAWWFVRVGTLPFEFWMGRGRCLWKNTYVSNRIFYTCLQLCQMTLFLHYFCDRKMLPDLHFRMNLCPARSGSWVWACTSCAQASWIVRVASLPCRRRRSPIIFRQKNIGFCRTCPFLPFCKFLCCGTHIGILMWH